MVLFKININIFLNLEKCESILIMVKLSDNEDIKKRKRITPTVKGHLEHYDNLLEIIEDEITRKNNDQ